MATPIDLTTYQNNDTTVLMAVTFSIQNGLGGAAREAQFAGQVVIGASSTSAPLNITTMTPKFILKATSTTADSSALATLTVGSGLTITNATIGQLSALLGGTALLGTPATLWWRLDLTGSGQTETAMFGHLFVLAV